MLACIALCSCADECLLIKQLRHNVTSLAQLGAVNRAYRAASARDQGFTHVVRSEGDDEEGHPAVMDVVNYRGMHDSCADVDAIVRTLPQVQRVVLGHTAFFTVHATCGGRLLAADSLLGRCAELPPPQLRVFARFLC